MQNFGVGIFDGLLFSVCNRLRIDGVAVVVVQNEKIVVSACRWYDKSACLVGTYLAGDRFACHVDMVRAMSWNFLEFGRCKGGLCCGWSAKYFGVSGGFRMVRDDVYRWGLALVEVVGLLVPFGRSEIGSLRVHVAHGGSFGMWSVLIYLLCGQFGPGIKVTGGDGFHPSWDNR